MSQNSKVFFFQGGDCLLEVFANPSGGPERLTHVSRILSGNLEPKTILRVDKARAYLAWAMDNPDVSLIVDNKIF